MPEATCPGCHQNAGVVVDVTTGNVRRVCTSCNRLVTVPDADEERRDWFSSGPLTQMGPLYGWGSSPPSLPGEGPQSWLFCPLISLGLLVVEARRAVPLYSTGPRAPVPDPQAQFWTSRARDVIHAFADHFSSLASDNPLAVTLSSQVSWGPTGDHLEACIQDALTPLHITSMLEVWLTSQAGSFVGDAEQSRQSPPPTAPAPPSSVPSDPVPSPFLSSPREATLASSRSPFAAQHSAPPLHGVVVSNPFVTTTAPVEARGPTRNRPSPLPGVGPARLTRFLEMSSAAGRFRAGVRLEGQTAWGVWLRIDHWRASRGGSRLRCGVLFHPVNRELTFHGVASVVTQLLLPLFEDWTFPSVELLPSARPAQHGPLDDPSVPEDAFNRFLGPSSHPRPHATSASTRPAPPPPPPTPPPGEEHSLRFVISGLVAVCEANQVSIRHLTTEVHALRQQLLRNAACPRRPAPSPPLPPSPPTIPASGRLPPRQMCRRIGCDSHPHVSCTVGYCVTHCTSPRCQHPSTVRRATPATVPVPQSMDSPVLPPSLSSARVPPPPRPTPSVRHCPVGSHPTGRPPPRSLCRRRGCQEPVHPECTTRHCNFHCHSDRCRGRLFR